MVTANQPEPASPSWPAYVVPMAGFVLITLAESRFPDYYVGLYIGKLLTVGALLVICRAAWTDIRPNARFLPIAIFAGLAVFAQWILLDRWIPYPHLGARTGFDPSAIGDPGLRMLFLTARFAGLVILVPVMEELFWRSLLLRLFTDSGWRAIPAGSYSWTAFGIVAAGFAAAHPEWLVAAICACAYALLLRRTRSLFACVVAHAVTNLALGVYVVAAHDWKYW